MELLHLIHTEIKTVTFEVTTSFEEDDSIIISGLYVKSQNPIPETFLSLDINTVDKSDYLTSDYSIRIGSPTIRYSNI